MFPPPPSRQMGGGWNSGQYNTSSFLQGPSSHPSSGSTDWNNHSVQNVNLENHTVASSFNQVHYSSNFGAQQNRGVAQQSAVASQQNRGPLSSNFIGGNVTILPVGAASHPTYHNYQPQSKDAFTPTATQISYPLPPNLPGALSDSSGNVQLTSSYPLWTKQINRLPPIYRDVIKHSISPNGQHLDTGRVYSVLMTSQLPKPTLGHLWSLVNRETVGILSVPEGLMLLVLVALTQSNRIGVSALHDISFLHQLPLDPSFPNPSLAIPQNMASQVNPVLSAQPNPVDTSNCIATPQSSKITTGIVDKGVAASLSNHSVGRSHTGSQSNVNTAINQRHGATKGLAALAIGDIYGVQQSGGISGGMGEENSNEIDRQSSFTRSEHPHCSCMESSCDGFNPDITVGVEVGGEFDVEDDGGIVYIAEDILYSGGESESQADSYQSSSCSSPGQMASAYNSPKHVVSNNQTPVAVAPPFQLPTEPSTPVNSLAPKMQHSQRSATNFDYVTTSTSTSSFVCRNQGYPAPFHNRQNSGSSLGSPKIPLSTLATFSASFSPTGSGKEVTDKAFVGNKSATEFESQSNSKQESGDDFGDFADFESATPQPSLSPYLANILNNQKTSTGNSKVNLSDTVPKSSLPAVTSALEVKTNWPPRDRTISSSSTISSHSIKLPSVLQSPGGAVSPSLRVVAASATANQNLNQQKPFNITAISVATGHEQQKNTEKDTWFQKFQNVQPDVRTSVTENEDDDFTDFQNFTEAVGDGISVPLDAATISNEVKPDKSNVQPFDKYAVFRDLMPDSAENDQSNENNLVNIVDTADNEDSKSKCQLTNTKGENFDMTEVFEKKQTDALQIVPKENESDFADFASAQFSIASPEVFQSNTVKDGQLISNSAVGDNPIDLNVQTSFGNITVEESDWANFDSAPANKSEWNYEKQPDNYVLNNGLESLNVESSSDTGLFPRPSSDSVSESINEAITKRGDEESSWANFEAFGVQTSSEEPNNVSAAAFNSDIISRTNETQENTEVEEIVSQVTQDHVTEAETVDEWTAFGDDESSTMNTGADVSGLIWAKQQVSADGLYDRIKQTIMSEEVKKPAASMATVTSTVRSFEKGDSSAVGNEVSVGGSEGAAELINSGATKKSSAKGLATERYMGLEKEFAFSDGTRQRKVWLKLVTECEEIMRCGLEAVQQEDNELVKSEVMSSKQWSSFCTGLCLVYGVVVRIKRSFTVAKLYDDALTQIFDRIAQAWSELKQFFPEEVLTSSVYLSSTNEECTPATATFGAEACGVCLLRAIEDDKSSKEESSRNVDRSLYCLSFGGRKYHAPCANLWVNKVDLVLPALLVIDVL
ncbi:uncharacterized protein LOC142345726 isoform X3 [Convolutriloba macropyga]|uniref:uncharacterized protein LOC142345726 isoform X3 n=1 Tax=Convolutriloba macropyga TaxID=536237 RepID=UPI003F5204B6